MVPRRAVSPPVHTRWALHCPSGMRQCAAHISLDLLNGYQMKPIKPRQTSASEPPSATGKAPMGPAEIVYLPGGTLMPRVPLDLDIPPAQISGETRTGRTLANGLTPRADAMARLVARGATLSDAYRAAYQARPDIAPEQVTYAAHRITNKTVWRDAIGQYRGEMERKRAQAVVNMRDFVLGRLTLEAQTAGESSSRIRALELLGKTEALFTDVRRTERSISPKDLEALKSQLYQRLSTALGRFSPSLSLGMGTANGPPSAVEEEKGSREPHPPGEPLAGERDPPQNFIVTPPYEPQPQASVPTPWATSISPNETNDLPGEVFSGNPQPSPKNQPGVSFGHEPIKKGLSEFSENSKVSDAEPVLHREMLETDL